MRLKWCYSYHYYYFHYCLCEERRWRGQRQRQAAGDKGEKKKLLHSITITASKSLLTTTRLTFSVCDNWLADCCMAYILWPWRSTQSWQRTKSMKLLLISWVYRLTGPFAGSFMCCTACWGCGVGVMMLSLMWWAYLSLGAVLHLLKDATWRVKSEDPGKSRAVTEEMLLFNPAFLILLN